MDGRATSKKIQSFATSSIILPRRGRMIEEVAKDSSRKSYPNHSSFGLIPSSVQLVVILPPSVVPPPSPIGEAALRAKLSAAALGLRVFGCFRQNGVNGLKTRRPVRCLPKGSVFRAVFFGLNFKKNLFF